MGGGAALLDSGAGAIRVGSNIFEMVLRHLPNGCGRAFGYGIHCPCADVGAFPTLAFSFLSSKQKKRGFLESATDALTCVPPEEYVTKVANPATGGHFCSVAILDAGPNMAMFETEAVVLGIP